MKHGSLFSGIGGFDLAAEWMDWENVFHCEWNPFGQRVLKHYWPNAESFEDITKTDFTKYHGAIDIISGGFPCQPYSAAGKRLGKADERHLWPHMLRAIAEIAPRYVVGENVRGLTNWNRGMVFDEVCVDLENLGYSVAPYLIPACATNAPHKRERIWFIAYANGRTKRAPGTSRSIEKNRSEKHDESSQRGESTEFDIGCREFLRNASDSQCIDLENERNEQRSMGKENSRQSTTRFEYGNIRSNWSAFPTSKPTICGRNNGFSNELDGITFSKWRNESIRAYGNAVVPNVVFEIFKAIEKFDQTNEPT
jgi:DNA (cytosine-5)-methyltransferase 1